MQKNQSVLVFSYLGFLTLSTVIGDSETIAISLEEDVAHLDEVAVMGMGVQRER